ncbi:MAG TPA: c-type cytochrome [Cyclobacteriaceae bacterium]|jgi:glucose/arabinose dehydrogenase/mono/diheme cytochrome c family protein|nr:c-type cytochrome [Cyclobacteriaceae bacterium]
MNKSILLLCLSVAALSIGCSKKKELTPDKNNGGITLPEKFGAVVVVDSISRGRHMAIASNGDIYLHLARPTADGKGIVAVRDSTGDGRADIIKGYSEVTGTGIELHNGYLYYADNLHVYRSKITGGNLLPDQARDTVVTLVGADGHSAKIFTFDNKGSMYVNVGSLSNCCETTLRMPHTAGDDPCKELETRAGIWKFDDNTLGQKQDLQHRYATGIRNAVALDWNFNSGKLYALQHGRDDLHRYWPEFYSEEQNTELPSEIFFDLEEGSDMGWPYIYYDHIQKKSFLNPEYGGDGKKTDRVDKARAPLLGFPGHWAPNDVVFYKGDLFPEKYKNGAFIAFHGSWNRLGHEQQGFKVVFVPMKDGKPSGDYEVFADGFIGPEPITNPGNAFFRPCGLAEGPDGSLYISDSQHGRIWRIMYYPDGVKETSDRALFVPEVKKEEEKVPDELQAGRVVYNTYCAPCHQRDGKGAPGMNPPLAGINIVTGNKTELIKIILKGYDKPTKINGESYQNVMPPHAWLADQQIADVLTYIRKSWGNKADEVKVDEVKKTRATVAP